MTKLEKIELLHQLYGWNKVELSKHNDAQIHTLFSACQDEDGELRKK